MAGVFLSYDRDDTDKARPIALALEKAGHSVWWDLHLRGGAQFSKVIDEALSAADAVVVLWSKQSIESAWVRDEAAVGRDTNRLVPVTLDGTPAPLGFRQFQTLDLSGWRGRGKAAIEPLLATLESYDAQGPAAVIQELPAKPRGKPVARLVMLAVACLALLAAAGVGAWKWIGRSALPVVAVTAANSSPRSQAAANDLFIKLGSLAQVGKGKWHLVDAPSPASRPDFLFRTTDSGSEAEPHASLALLDGKNKELLWSREFNLPAGGEADLRQQLSLTAARVLGCALETKAEGGLRRDLIKLFLNTCATSAETSIDNPSATATDLRSIVTASPRFAPAWGRLLYADANLIDVTRTGGGDEQAAIQSLQRDMRQARAVAPDLPELTIAEMRFLPPTAYSRRLALFAKAAQRAPESAQIFADQSFALQQVGRMSDAVESSRRAAELDPLSPAVATQLIMALAHGGQLNNARQELARAEKLWAGTGALRDALWAFHLRYGDPKIAKKYARNEYEGILLYLNARDDPSAANIEKLVTFARQFQQRAGPDDWGWGAQALSEFNHNDEVFTLLARTPVASISADSYLLFRPGFAGLRRDRRFIALAKRIGLIDYWQSSGKWPDFCYDSDLPYDCKAEAAKLG